MNAKNTVTACMVFVGILALISQGWTAKIRSVIQTLSGSA